jgi:predicted ArsR family transcriptional regulator
MTGAGAGARAHDKGRARARALGDATRATIHRLLTEADHPLTVTQLTELTRIHRTAVGQHLAVLRQAGLVERSVAQPAGRGRPGFAYRAIDVDPYRSLSFWLAEAVRSGRSARDTGREAGARLATTGGDPIDVIVDTATAIGFDPVRRERPASGEVEVVLRSCPFEELAAADPATVCDLHLGIVEGLTQAIGGAEVTGLTVTDPRRGGCRITLRRLA